MGFSRQEYWSGLPFPSPGHLPNPGIKPVSPSLPGGFFATEQPGKPQVQFSRVLWKCTLFGLDFFTQRYFFETHPCCAVSTHSFSFLSNIPIYSSIHLMLDICVVLWVGLLQMKLMWTFIYKSFHGDVCVCVCVCVCVLIFCEYLGLERLGNMICVCLSF